MPLVLTALLMILLAVGTIRANRPERFALGGLFVALLLAGLTQVICDDHWWHLATARLVLESGSIPRTDPFSFTYAAQTWVNWEWLSGVAMLAAWNIGGPAGLVVLRVLVLAGVMGLLWRHARGRTEPESARGLLSVSLVLALVLMTLQGRLGDRPHVYSYLLIAFVPFWLSWCWRSARDPRPWLTWVPLFAAFLVWVNLHPSWTVGFALAGAAAADRIWARLRENPRCWREATSYRPLLLPLALLPSLAFVPGALDYHGPFRTIFQEKASVEWDNLLMHLGLGVTPVLAFLLLALAWLPTALGLLRRGERVAEVLVITGIFAFALVHVRFTAVAVILAAPLVAPWLARRLPAALDRPRQLFAALLLLMLLLFGALIAFQERNDLVRGLGLDPSQNPVGVADFMAAQQLGGRVFATTKEAHSYLSFRLYPALHVFIDGRVPQLYPTAFLREYEAINSPESLDATLSRYPIDRVVLVKGLFTPTSEGVAGHLERRGDFDLLYADEHGALFARRDTHSGRAFRLLNPWRLAARPDWENTLDPAERAALRDELAYLNAIAPGTGLTRALNARLETGNP